MLLQDLSFIERRSKDTRQYLIILIASLGAVIALVTVIVAQLSWRGWVKGTRALLRGEGLVRPLVRRRRPNSSRWRPNCARACATWKTSTGGRKGPETEWTAQRLQSLLRTQLRGDQVIVVSNREPYLHERQGERRCRAASGQRPGHRRRAGDARMLRHLDRARQRQRRPGGGGRPRPRGAAAGPATTTSCAACGSPPEEEKGYYYGFANEGMWPLCHVAHVRPVFRESDWQHYQAVNQRFADAVVAEARSEDPVVLVQDYHFALLPAMVRKKLPRATILTFWHIPWPNPESFGICPWRREILEGMLGSTILGFHTPFHCKNFMETVDRYLEARIEHEHSTISFHGDKTFVESYPISIEWPTPAETRHWLPVDQCRRNVFERLEIPLDHRLAVGVDRFDYTKGILERLHAVERMLEKYPEWLGRFTMVQVAAPSREVLEEYQAFRERDQRRSPSASTSASQHPGGPVVRLLATHHDHDAVYELYRAADVCLVTSLHDGMNLVCKEFVAARDDERGVLILSRFAGAAREMPEALIVNPYHVEETADALHRALTMPEAEQRERMASLRTTVREFNVYRWAGRMLSDAGRWRLRERIAERVQRHQVE